MNRIVIVSTIMTASFLSFNVGADGNVDRPLAERESNNRMQGDLVSQVDQRELRNQERPSMGTDSERGRLGSEQRNRQMLSRESKETTRSSDKEDNLNRRSDDTGKNVKDRDDKTLTPMDQGSSEQDRKIVALIRNEVVKNDQLSLYARNSKIIVRDGNVTLRGPVRSNEEIQIIEKIATKHSAGGKVDNQLEVVSE